MSLKLVNSNSMDSLNLYREQFSIFQEYHTITKEMLILCEGEDFTQKGPLEQLMKLVFHRQQLIEKIENNKAALPAFESVDSIDQSESGASVENNSAHKMDFLEIQKIMEETLTLLKELSPLNQKVQELLENELSHLKEIMISSRKSLKAHKTYYPQEKQHEGVFLESLVGEK